MWITPQALVNEWDEQERREKEKEQMEASLYRHRSRLHGSGLSEEEQEEKDFRSRFPQFNKVRNLLVIPNEQFQQARDETIQSNHD